MYGKDAVTDLTCQNWFVKFHVGDFLLDDAPWTTAIKLALIENAATILKPSFWPGLLFHLRHNILFQAYSGCW